MIADTYTIRGYYNAPERNAEAFTADGFYRTGDLVRSVEHDGATYYRLEGRIKDVINRGGEKVNAPEIEELVCRHLSVANASLVAMPDERLGERACVYIVAKKGAAAPDLGELRRHLDALGVAKFKWPERVEVRDELPLTNVQKVDKVRLRQEVAQLIAKERDDQSSGLSPSGGSR